MTDKKPVTRWQPKHSGLCTINSPWAEKKACDCGLAETLMITLRHDELRIATERVARLAAEARVKVLTEALRTVQWDVRGKCTACAGWNMSPFGETVKVHTADCPVAAALNEHANG